MPFAVWTSPIYENAPDTARMHFQTVAGKYADWPLETLGRTARLIKRPVWATKF